MSKWYDNWLTPLDSITVAPMEEPVSFKEAMESNKTYTLKDLNGAPKFIKSVNNWNEFDEFINSSNFEDNVGYIILKSDSNQYFGRSGSSWIDISESYRDFIKEYK